MPVLRSDVGIDAMQQNLRTDARLILGFIGIIWLVFLIDVALPVINLVPFGLMPRTVHGLFGIVTTDTCKMAINLSLARLLRYGPTFPSIRPTLKSRWASTWRSFSYCDRGKSGQRKPFSNDT